MQDITPTIKNGKKQIEAYGNGGFKVSGERFSGNLIILPDSTHEFKASDIETTTENDLLPVISSDTEILLVGSGETSAFFSKQLEKALRANNIIFEYMNTGAAVRTYNVLLTEERKVAVVLIAV